PFERGKLLPFRVQRQRLQSAAKIEAERRALTDKDLGGFPPEGASALNEPGCDEDRERHLMLGENRRGEFGIVAVAIVKREADEGALIVGIGKQRRQVFSSHRHQPTFKRGLYRLLEKLRSDRQDAVRIESMPVMRPHMMQREDDAATACPHLQCDRPEQRDTL